MIRNFLLFVLLTSALKIYSQPILEKAGELSAKSISKSISKLPKGSKVSMAFFNYDNGFSDTIRTYLGIQLTKNIAHKLKSESVFKKQKYNFLFPEGVDSKLYESMRDIFTIPTDQNEFMKWQSNFLEQQTADFFIVGKYQLSNNLNELRIIRIEIIPNYYGKYKNINPVGAKNSIINITNKADKDELSRLNHPLNQLGSNYLSLIKWSSSNKLISNENIIDDNGKIVSKSNLLIGQEYSIEAEIEKDAYIYGFYYGPDDDNKMYITMLYPYEENKNEKFPKGKISIPPNASFVVEPPAHGQVYIKIIASEEKIPISFTTENLNGEFQAVFSDSDCENFLNHLNKINKSRVGEVSLTKIRTTDK